MPFARLRSRSKARIRDARPQWVFLILRLQRAVLLSEFGVVAPIGRNGIEQLLVVINDETDTRIPADARLYTAPDPQQARCLAEATGRLAKPTDLAMDAGGAQQLQRGVVSLLDPRQRVPGLIREFQLERARAGKAAVADRA